MKIMELISGWGVNGAIVTCLEVTRALLSRGHEITLVCRPNAWIAEQFEPGEIEIVYSDMHRLPPDELRRVAAIAREREIDVLHSHMSRANFFGILLRRIYGLPCVATANNRNVQLHWMFNDHVIAASEATKRFHHRVNLVPNRKIEVVHNFIRSERFHGPDKDTRAKFCQEHNIAPDKILIGQVGDVIPRKGLIYLVRALPAILRECPNCQVLAIGLEDNQPYVAKIRAEAERMGVTHAITWLGHQANVARTLSILDIMVLATLEDNLPLSILEAMASELPVVATRVGGIPECVTDGRTGRLVPPAKSKDLGEAIIALAKNPALRTEMGRAARAIVRRDFSPASQTAKIERVLEKAARPKRLRKMAG